MIQGELFNGGRWRRVRRCDDRARALADRHYSRQTVGAAEFLPPGQTLVLLSTCGRAVWGVCCNWFRGRRRWRLTIFRNEGAGLSSELIREATTRTRMFWMDRYRYMPPMLTTEIDVRRVRRKRDPGRCFIRAGWRQLGTTTSHRHRGALVLVAP